MATPSEIIAQYDHLLLHNANEADTRLKVINEVLYSILGWTHSDLTTEERVSEDGGTTWADYVLRTGMTAVVVEAKKAGIAFSSVPESRRVQLNSKLVKGELGAAITQARDYARKLSIPFAVVTNGNAWIVFPATRVDQVSFQNSSAIVFPSLRSALQDDYAEFHDLLSREAVISGSLENELLGRIENQIGDRRLNIFFTSGFSKVSRHSLFPLIEDAITTAFTEDIVNSDRELLEKCYVRTPERVRFDSRIRMHVAKRETVTNRAAVRPLKERGVSSTVSEAAKRSRPAALLVLGPVGAGKTTFLDFTRKVDAREVFDPRGDRPYPHWFHVDFRAFSKGQAPLPFLLNELKSRLNEDPFLSDYERCLRHAYKDEVDALLRGPLFLIANDESERKRRISQLMIDDYEQTQPYVEKVIKYAATNAPVFIVIDNIDQFEEESIQSEIFAEAMALAQKLKVSLICSMREATYVRHRNTPLFDAFDFEPIAIDPPQVQAVLSKRFFVARQLLQGKSAEFTAENGAQVRLSDLSVVIDLVQGSVLGSEIGSLIEVLATSDIRLALRMTREFLQSGWTASGKALRIYQATGRYVMPQHEALRAIMLGTQTVYAEAYSVLGNPFDSRLARTEAQLLRLYVLTAAVQLSSEATFRYIEGTEVQEIMREIGFGDLTTMSVLADLCKFRFMNTVSHSQPSLEANFVVTRLGGYIVRHFLADMMYLENVMMDTFIPDAAKWEELRAITTDVYSTRDTLKKIRLRKERVRMFYEYMSTLYTPLRDESIRRGLPREWCTHPLDAAQTQLTANLERVLRSAERNYGTAATINNP